MKLSSPLRLQHNKKKEKNGKKVHLINCFSRNIFKRKNRLSMKNKGKPFKNAGNSPNSKEIKKQREIQRLSNTKAMENWFKQKEKREKKTKINYFNTTWINHEVNTALVLIFFNTSIQKVVVVVEKKPLKKQQMPTLTLLFIVLFP